MALNPAPCPLRSESTAVTDSLYNPFEAPQASLSSPKQPPKRKGLLLMLTLFHASVAGLVVALGTFSAGSSALWIIKNLVNDRVLNQDDAVFSFVATLTFAMLAFLMFRAECRSFRPLWIRERKILAAWLLTTLPLILWTLSHVLPGKFSSVLPPLSDVATPVCITSVWLGSILIRAWLWRHQWHGE